MKIKGQKMSNWRGPILMQKSRHYPGVVTLNEKVRLQLAFMHLFNALHCVLNEIATNK